MSWDNKKDDWQLSVRTGPAIGKASEGRMLDAMGGSDTIKKRFQTNADGSVTLAHTRGPGTQPEFITTGNNNPADTYAYYMETGQLGWSWPGEGNPTRLYPAKWHFLDIGTSSPWLGNVRIAPVAGEQRNKPALTEGQDSLSVGPPSLALVEDYSGSTLMKKIVTGMFPSSLFSGKMRLFMQAIYGAKETLAPFPLSVDVIGESAILRYKEVQFGFWGHSTPGIFAAPDGTWWLLVIRTLSGTYYNVTAYPITQTAAGKELVKLYKTTPSVELEAYIFAHSEIQTKQPQVIGGFDGAKGSAMAYGWKWNTDGTEARVVVHECAGDFGDMHWKSSTMRLSIGYNGGAFSLSADIQGGGDWTDGWGMFNIFVPGTVPSSGPLQHLSLATSRAEVRPTFNFSGVPVYGYYKDDTWVPVTMSRTFRTGETIVEIETIGNVTFTEGLETSLYRADYARVPGNEGCTFINHEISESTSMDVSVGGATIFGVDKYGRHGIEVRSVSSAGEIPAPFASPIDRAGVDTYPDYEPPPRYPGTPGFPILPGWNWPAVWTDHFYTMHYGTVVSEAYTGNQVRAWTLVIPHGDCSAVYVAEKSYLANVSGFSGREIAGTGYSSGRAVARTGGGDESEFPPCSFSWDVWNTGNQLGWGAIAPPDAKTTSYSTPSQYKSETKVTCFNTEVSGVAGTPGGSYHTLFEVDYNYPQYDRGMTMKTSYNNRYVGSELPAVPESVNRDHNFVGWA